jgi:hypothetical protein
MSLAASGLSFPYGFGSLKVIDSGQQAAND